jgi:hypothetical protein
MGSSVTSHDTPGLSEISELSDCPAFPSPVMPRENVTAADIPNHTGLGKCTLL